MSPILQVKELTKRFGGLTALNNVNINVNENSITLIAGPNGSGKTTLLNVISGILKPDSGKVIFKDKDITGKEPFEIYKLGIVRTFQIPQIIPKLTVLDNVLLAVNEHPGEKILKSIFKKSWVRYEKEIVDKAFKILELTGLQNVWNIEAYKLSGGQMKLLEIARALMANAKLILMDEIVAGLNPVIAHEIFNYIKDIKTKLGITFLIVEHRLDVVYEYVDYVYVMAYGKVISEGEPLKVFNDDKVLEVYLGRE